LEAIFDRADQHFYRFVVFPDSEQPVQAGTFAAGGMDKVQIPAVTFVPEQALANMAKLFVMSSEFSFKAAGA
jgi:hypothetical protein